MAEKIESQFCNPNTMQKAWDGIREECDHFDSAVGMMAETCSLDNLLIPGCKLPGVNLEYAEIPIIVNTGGGGLDFDFDIVFQIGVESFNFNTGDLMENEIGEYFSRSLYFNAKATEGQSIEITVYNNETDEELAREAIDFTFARNSYWSSRREVTVNDISVDHPEVDIVFTNW
ncbi:MAG: hypothetical protein R3220_02860 [Balneolaceae bacterium]|nr:hypothetical protein [Balneolaceae bacterium]